MAATIVRAIRDSAYRKRLGTNGRQVAVSEHDPATVAAGYYAHLQRTANENFEAKPMRVALDMRWITPGQAGGLENLARSFANHLIALDRHNRYTMIVPAACRHDFDLRGRDNYRLLSRDSLGTIARDLGWQTARRVHATLGIDYWRSHEVQTLKFLRSLDADMVYSFPGYIHPEVFGLRQILMVPDIQHEYFPEFFSEQALDERRRIYTDSIQRADHICAISEFTRRTLIDRLNVPPQKVTAVLLAADPIFRADADRAADQRRLAKYDLHQQPFLFFPGHTWKHKNHRVVIAAMAILRDRFGISAPLICTGGTREAQPALEKQIEETGLRGQVRFLGYCPHGDLPALYRQAGCLVFPSLFEGFGIPVLEAMASGCPVVCSNTTSLPEIAGDAALLVDPADPESLAVAIRTVLSDLDLRKMLINRGLAQAARFSWRRHALETVSVFQRVHRQLRSVSA
jgi:glycosyltransferase involved in cell wall biosynthesis